MESINVLEMFKYFKKKILFLIGIFILFIILGICYSKFFVKTVYRAESSLTSFSVKYSISEDAYYTYVDNAVLTTFSEIIKSKTVLDKVIDDLDLNIGYKELKNNISVVPTINLAVLTINVTYNNEQDAIDIANKVAYYFEKEIDNLVDSKYSDVHILDNANEAQKISNPSKTKILCIFTLFGLVIGIGIVFIIYYFDNRIKSLDNLKNDFKLRIVGKIHKTKNKTILNEDYKLLKNNLMFDKLNSKKILITSSTNFEESDNISYDLSNIFTLDNKKIVLLNFDYNSKLFKKIKCNFLCDIHTKYNKNNLKNYRENLYIISNNTNDIDFTEINELIKKLEKDFDYIIINAPSINTFADTLMLSKLVDSVILVCGIDIVKYDIFKETLTTLNDVGANVLGVVASNVENKE